MDRIQYYSVDFRALTDRDLFILSEIGRDRIDSASSFVEYMSETYGFSKSSVWYNLNKLKGRRLLDFATKDSKGKQLSLTKRGLESLSRLPEKSRLVYAYNTVIPQLRVMLQR